MREALPDKGAVMKRRKRDTIMDIEGELNAHNSELEYIGN